MDIVIPELGESITEGTIATWMKQEGDTVRFGDLLLELETDKVNLEINAEADGVLEKIMKSAGDTVQVGEAVGRLRALDAGGGAPAGDNRAGAGAAPGAAAAATPGEPAGEQPPQGASGGQAAAAAGGSAGGAGQAAAKAEAAPAAAASPGDAAAAWPPSVRRLARERGLDLAQLQPGPGAERITRAAVEAHASGARRAAEAPQPGPARPAAADASSSAAASKPVERQRMSRRRLTIANRLVEAQRTAAMLTTFNEVDMTAILDIRKRRKQSFQEKHDVGLGFMSFFTKAVVGALKQFPLLNAEIQGEELLVKKYYDIGIAVSAKEGLVVPVVRDAERLSFAEIERQIADLASKARTNSLALSDLQGGTFTITNGGVFGSLLSTPILNTPQVGILGMHTIQRRPVALEGNATENRPMMYIALSYDHRIVDGSEAVRFLVTIKSLLEDPESLLLEG